MELKMREILFRGKRTDNGKWVEGCLDFNQDKSLVFIRTPHIIYTDVNMVPLSTVGQYTGLKDKNGKRIFEGDIVRLEHDDFAWDGESLEHRIEKGVIAYDCVGAPGIVVEYYNSIPVWSDFFNVLSLTDRIKDWSIEVIGNIHDNPELLEVR